MYRHFSYQLQKHFKDIQIPKQRDIKRSQMLHFKTLSFIYLHNHNLMNLNQDDYIKVLQCCTRTIRLDNLV